MRWKVPVSWGLALPAVCLPVFLEEAALSYGLQLLCLVLLAVLNRDIFVKGFRSLAKGRPGRDSMTAVSVSVLVMILQFAPACAILAVESLGKWILHASGAGEDEAELTTAEETASRVASGTAFAVMGGALIAGLVRAAAGADVYHAAAAGVVFCMAIFPESAVTALSEPIAKAVEGSEKLGVKIRNREVLRQAWALDEVVLDKRGTITEGMPEITDIIPIEGYFNLHMAGGLESRSAHPLGRAIREAALERPGRLEEFENLREYPGRGVSGERKGRRYLAGNETFMEEMGVKPDYREGRRLLKEGKTVVYFAASETIVGIIALRDGPRATGLRAVRMIESMGIDVTMLTGDSRITADAICREVGIDRAIAQIVPGEKQRIISELRKGGRRKVAMVGDQVRDRAAIESADTSFVLGGGPEWADSQVDVILESSDLCDVARTVRLSRTTVLRGRENLVIAAAFAAAGLAAAVCCFCLETSFVIPVAGSAAFAYLAPVCEKLNSRRNK
ncbi:MAG: HAD-IC family P-type ATPase [Lentihominibacter sp.]